MEPRRVYLHQLREGIEIAALCPLDERSLHVAVTASARSTSSRSHTLRSQRAPEPIPLSAGTAREASETATTPLGVTAAADSGPCARCSSRRGRRAAPAAARHRGRAAPDGRPRARRVAPGAARDASPGRSSRGRATQSSTVRFASRRHADVRRTGWSGVRRKRLAKPGRPQRSQRRSFVVGQPQEPVWLSQPRQAQTRERAIHRSADLEQRRDVVAPASARLAARPWRVPPGPGAPAVPGGSRRRRRGRGS